MTKEEQLDALSQLEKENALISLELEQENDSTQKLLKMYFADSINLLVSIGEQTVTAINSNVPVSPFPYNVSTHIAVDSRIKVLTRRITVHKSEIPSSRDTSSQATPLQIRQFISQAALELCFDNQKDFNDYTTKHFNWKYAMCLCTLFIIDLRMITQCFYTLVFIFNLGQEQ